jgi:hypothetical protein
MELLTETPEPIELFVLFPEPIELLAETPEPIELFVLLPEPIELFTDAPDPMELFVLFPEPIELLVLTPEPMELSRPALSTGSPVATPDPMELSKLITRRAVGTSTPPSEGWVPVISIMSPATTSFAPKNRVAPLTSAIPNVLRVLPTGPTKYTCEAPGTYCPTERVASFVKRTELFGSMLPVTETYRRPRELFAPQTAAIPSASRATKVTPRMVTVRARQLAFSTAPTAAMPKVAEATGKETESQAKAINGATRDFPRGAAGDIAHSLFT